LQDRHGDGSRGSKNTIVARLRRPVLGDKIRRSDEFCLEGLNLLVFGGIQAVDDFIKCVVCRNRQTWFASQSAMRFQRVGLPEPALKILLDPGDRALRVSFTKSSYFFVYAGQDISVKACARAAFFMLHDGLKIRVNLLESEDFLRIKRVCSHFNRLPPRTVILSCHPFCSGKLSFLEALQLSAGASDIHEMPVIEGADRGWETPPNKKTSTMSEILKAAVIILMVGRFELTAWSFP
jgi:hypothetical protein